MIPLDGDRKAKLTNTSSNRVRHMKPSHALSNPKALEAMLRWFVFLPPRARWSILGLALVAFVLWRFFGPSLETQSRETKPPVASGEAEGRQVRTAPSSRELADGEARILDAFERRQSGVIVRASAAVAKLLPDDEIGDRHQKMILRLSSGHTLLLAHNIDLSERVPARKGDTIEFQGQYEYSEQGGVVHWTHPDPRNRRPGGWIRHAGQTY